MRTTTGALAILALFMLTPTVASAQCQKCNEIMRACSWGPWINGYHECLTVGLDCVQSDPCEPTALNIDGSVRAAFSPSLLTLVAEASIEDVPSSFADWVEMGRSRDCRGYLITSETAEEAHGVRGQAWLSEVVL